MPLYRIEKDAKSVAFLSPTSHRRFLPAGEKGNNKLKRKEKGTEHLGHETKQRTTIAPLFPPPPRPHPYCAVQTAGSPDGLLQLRGSKCPSSRAGQSRHEGCYCRRPATVEPGIQGARVEFLQGKDALTNYHGQSPTQFPYPSIVEDCRRREVWSVGQAFPVWPNLFLVFPPHRMRRVGSCLPTYLGRARSSKLSFGVRSKFWWAKIAATTTARLHCMYWLRRESMILGFSRQRSPPGRDGVGSTKYSTLHIPSDIVYICVCVYGGSSHPAQSNMSIRCRRRCRVPRAFCAQVLTRRREIKRRVFTYG